MHKSFRSKSAEVPAFYQENIDVTAVICDYILKNEAPVNAIVWAYSKSGIFCFDGRNIIKYNRIGEYRKRTHSCEDTFELGTRSPVKDLGISEKYYVYYPEKDWSTFCITLASDKNNTPLPEYSSFIVSEVENEEREMLTIISDEMIKNYLN